MLALRTPVQIDSPLPADECLRRLSRITMSRFTFFTLLKSKAEFPLVGTVGAGSCSLRYRTSYRNSFQRRLDLSAQPGPAGTSLTGQFALPTSILAFCILWIAFVGLFGAVMLAQYFTGGLHTDQRSSALLFLIPPGMIVFLVALTTFGLWLSRLTERPLLEVIARTVDGKIVVGLTL